jgi:hypothetical protein
VTAGAARRDNQKQARTIGGVVTPAAQLPE